MYQEWQSSNLWTINKFFHENLLRSTNQKQQCLLQNKTKNISNKGNKK